MPWACVDRKFPQLDNAAPLHRSFLRLRRCCRATRGHRTQGVGYRGPESARASTDVVRVEHARAAVTRGAACDRSAFSRPTSRGGEPLHRSRVAAALRAGHARAQECGADEHVPQCDAHRSAREHAPVR